MFTYKHFKVLDSTNTEAQKHNIHSIIVADSQTAGKGKMQNNWDSKPGGIYISIICSKEDFSFLRVIDEIQLVTFVAAISCVKAFRDITLTKKVTLKWPNDLIIENKKVGGILTILFDEKIIIGIGINNHNKVSRTIPNSTSLIENDIVIDNKFLIAKIAHHLEETMTLEKEKILNLWRDYSDLLGEMVLVKTTRGELTGIFYNISDQGRVILKTKNGLEIIYEEILSLRVINN